MRPFDRGRLGATPIEGGNCSFVVWAPRHRQVEVHLVAEEERIEPLERGESGYHHAVLKAVPAGSRYVYRLSGKIERPDPASRLQAEGVHESSEVVDLAYEWTDHGWTGRPLSEYVLYELHVGTFSSEGSFDGVIPHLSRLRDLGITALELMPVAQFPGTRNWGYDGVYPFACQSSYGGPRGLQRLVNACHEHQLGVVLDVVYNHLGPEGNYLEDYGPYFSSVHRTPWGKAVNFDGPGSDEVRYYFIENALHWIRDFHIDGLRLDAVHAILDRSARPFLEELASEVHALASSLGRHVPLIAESNLNDPRLIRHPDSGGPGLDSMWCDDLHHSAHALLTGERVGYYVDFGSIEHLDRAWKQGMTYTGQYSAYRQRRHGRPVKKDEPQKIVVYTQNHDQTGNRLYGERLGALAGFEAEKLAAGIICLSPCIPLVFMGQEYGETAPFLYFISHGRRDLVEAVRRGRRHASDDFGWQGEIEDPQHQETFRRSRLNHDLRGRVHHSVLTDLYSQLFRLRRQLATLGQDETRTFEPEKALFVSRGHEAWMIFHFGREESRLVLPVPGGRWTCSIDSAASRWHGPGKELPGTIHSRGEICIHASPQSFAVYTRSQD